MRQSFRAVVCTVALATLLFSFQEARSQEKPVSMNGLIATPAESSQGYSFFAAGHLYGSPDNRDSVMPASSILANLERINGSGAKFFVSLGDNVRSLTPRQSLNFKRYFVDRLNIPMFNAVGNHDMSPRTRYESDYGKTYFHFFYQTELYIVLDTELDVARISGEQLRYFQDVVNQATLNKDLKRVFIFSHKLLWAVDPAYQVVYEHLNPSPGYPTANSFNEELGPLVRRLAKSVEVFWISGDIGCAWSLPLFYERQRDLGVTFVAVGIGETQQDAMIQVFVPKEGDLPVEITPIPLAGASFEEIEHYDRRYWEAHFHASNLQQESQQSNPDESLGSRAFSLATSKRIWAGFVTGIAFCGLVIIGRRKWSAR